MRPFAAARRPLRNDPVAWQIEDDDVAEAALEAVEALGLLFAEMVLHRVSRLHLDPADGDLDLAVRAIGSVAGRVGMSRLAWLSGVDEAGHHRRDSADSDSAKAVGEAMRRVTNWLLAWDLTDPDAPPQLRPPTPPSPTVRLDLDELHAALIYLDRRAGAQGLPGPGRRRSIVRTTTRRRS